MMSPRQVEVQSFSFKVEFSEKKKSLNFECVWKYYIHYHSVLCVFFTGSPGCVLATLSRQVNFLSTYSKFENLKIIHFLFGFRQCINFQSW